PSACARASRVPWSKYRPAQAIKETWHSMPSSWHRPYGIFVFNSSQRAIVGERKSPLTENGLRVHSFRSSRATVVTRCGDLTVWSVIRPAGLTSKTSNTTTATSRMRRAIAKCLTVKLRGRTTTPDRRRGPTISYGVRGAKQTTPHGPLQRLLDANRLVHFRRHRFTGTA